MGIEEAIKDIYGSSVGITGKRPVYGGDINDSSMLTLSDGRKVFLKENHGKESDFFAAEAAGLRSIDATGTVDAAHVIAHGGDYLLLEYIETGSKSTSFWETFGRKLAAMHKADTSAFVSVGRFGFDTDNYIGASRQFNNACDTWIDFFRTMRLEVQFKMADRYFDDTDRMRISKFLDRLDDLLIEPARPSLLHGDLWGGNFMVSRDSQPVLIDPAVYVGHAEADIAMTELFGGFAPVFYDSYKTENPFEPGYADRRDIYNLYHILNHVNLFGSSYLPGAVRTLRRFAPL